MPQIFSDYTLLRPLIAAQCAAGKRVGFVPTMGALHAGHRSLIEAARRECDMVVASIFVNPLQFGPTEDLARYPRTLEADVELLTSAQADYLYNPTPEIMYPQGFASTIHVSGVSEGLCGAARPGHFDGVATVVAMLFQQMGASDAYFGEKDYQQLKVIEKMVADLCLPIRIHPVPTYREADGLAMSSRNRYLNSGERALAPILYQTLQMTAEKLRGGEQVQATLEQAIAALMQAGFAQVDYLELRDETTLVPCTTYHASCRILAAARLGSTRLIDNVAA